MGQSSCGVCPRLARQARARQPGKRGGVVGRANLVNWLATMRLDHGFRAFRGFPDFPPAAAHRPQSTTHGPRTAPCFHPDLQPLFPPSTTPTQPIRSPKLRTPWRSRRRACIAPFCRPSTTRHCATESKRNVGLRNGCAETSVHQVGEERRCRLQTTPVAWGATNNGPIVVADRRPRRPCSISSSTKPLQPQTRERIRKRSHQTVAVRLLRRPPPSLP